MSDSQLAFHSALPSAKAAPHTLCIDVLHPVREWLDRLAINDPKLARLLYKVIPGQCPFERDIILFGRKLRTFPLSAN
jgi:hypothetical protein